ncbi:MAG: acyl carrier protein [Verrucomicrobiota bacterium]
MPAMPARPDASAVRSLLGELCGRDLSGLDPDADLVVELGLDSLARLRLLARLETRFGIRFSDDRLSALRTLREVVEEAGAGTTRKERKGKP